MKTFRQTFFFVFFDAHALFSAIFFSSCGLDTIITIAEPTVTYNLSYYSTEDYSDWYCEFLTEENANSNLADGNFLGTEVYYKIYNNYSTLTTQKNAINTRSSSSSYDTTAAATLMIETYTYQPLITNPNLKAKLGSSVLIPSTGSDKRVYLRLKTYTNSDSINFIAAISFPRYTYYGSTDGTASSISTYYYDSSADTWTDSDGNSIAYENIQFIVPYRNITSTRSFDFFDDEDTKSDANCEPESGEADFYHSSSSSSEDTYYVQLFAVGVALDTSTLANTYSRTLDIGTIPIKSGQ